MSISLLAKWRLLQTALSAPELSPVAKCVLGRLLHHLNTDTGRCTPSYQTLAEGVGLKRRAVIYAVQDLERADWLTIGRVKGGDSEASRGFVTNNFRFNFERTTDHAPVHGDALPPGAPLCTPPGAPNDTPPVHGDAPPPVHGDAPKYGKGNKGKEGAEARRRARPSDLYHQAFRPNRSFSATRDWLMAKVDDDD